MRIVLLIIVAFVAFAAFRFWQAASYAKEHPRTAQPGQAAFEQANESISVNRGATAFGNTADARALAAAFSAAVLEITQTRFTGGKASALSTSKGEVLVHCQLGDDACVFIAHVPELRQYHDDVRDVLASLSWDVAQKLVAAKLPGKPMRLGLGLRGVALYGPIQVGTAAGGRPTISQSGIAGLPSLYPFFAPPTAVAPAAAAAEAPAQPAAATAPPAADPAPASR